MLNLAIDSEEDVVRSRMTAREVAAQLGFAQADQARIATAVSEVARNALSHGGGGNLRFEIERTDARPALAIEVSDQGPGIRDTQAVLDGRRGGQGLVSAQRLMDCCKIDSAAGQGTTVRLRKFLYADVPIPASLSVAKPQKKRGMSDMQDKLAEIHQQNRELAQAFEALRAREDELTRLNVELEDTNRGVVALYAELDAQAGYLRRADQLKSRFLSNMSHEFRTPLNSILALSQILLDRTDGDLSAEQDKQVRFMRSAAETLYEMVNDLLDLAKIEAGKLDVQPTRFDVSTMFAAMRGMLRPLLVTDSIVLSIVDPEDVPTLFSDEGKIAQILRNFVSNAIKFTEHGEIRVSACHLPQSGMVEFSVSDTGIGIAAEDQARIFDEFEQVENRLQKRVKGTGLGLPLCRRLAQLMGGSVHVESRLGIGSTFYARIPVHYGVAGEAPPQEMAHRAASTRGNRALVIDDSESTRYVLRKLLADFEVLEAVDGIEGFDAALATRPDLIFLDLNMPGMDGFSVLERLRVSDRTCDVPVIVVTSQPIDAADYEKLRGAQAVVSKSALSQESLRPILEGVLGREVTA